MRKTLSTLLMAALVASVFTAMPADAKKKKKKKKKPKAVACAPWTPAADAAEAEIVVVTDTATEEAPIEIPVTAPEGLRIGLEETDSVTGGGTVWSNIQVDSATPDAGLYVRLEWSAPAPLWDYDMAAFASDGTEIANAHGFNPDPEGPFAPESDGGHTESTAEQIDGVRRVDCDGASIGVTTASGPGGAMVLKVWLGEVQHEPLAPAE